MEIKLTEQQIDILNKSSNNLVIEARAGTGKTFTLKKIAEKYPMLKKQYWAFNTSIATEGKTKFAGIPNMEVSTVHSLAYREIVRARGYKLSEFGLNTYGMTKFFGLKDRVGSIILSHSIRKVTTFCGSDISDLSELDYYSLLSTEKAQNFYLEYKDSINGFAEKIWDSMLTKKLDITHDFYLKLWQLSKPNLKVDLILFDEGQDASPVMLDIFLNQKDAVKIIVGDSHQAIYGWRGAINALSKVGYERAELTESFRFPQSIANLAINCLENKNSIDPDNYEEIKLTGAGSSTGAIETRAVISRSNLAILEHLFENKAKYHKPYIEGTLNSLLNTNSGINLMDLHHLSNRNKEQVKNGFLKTFSSLEDVKSYYEEIDDSSINGSLMFLKKWSNILVYEIGELQEKVVTNPREADVVFSTIHKAKGKEWDEVTLLAPDSFDEGFPDRVPDKIQIKKRKSKTKLIQEDEDVEVIELTPEQKKLLITKWKEELNVYYVGLTRAKKKLIHDILWLPIQSETWEDSQREETTNIKTLEEPPQQDPEIGIHARIGQDGSFSILKNKQTGEAWVEIKDLSGRRKKSLSIPIENMEYLISSWINL